MKRGTTARRLSGLFRAAGVVLLVACSAASCGAGSQPASGLARGGTGKLALLIGIGEYAPASGWPKLSSHEDLALMTATLSRHGFPSQAVKVLQDREATRQGILSAVEQSLLGPGRQGDLAVLFFAGHGRQVTDESPGDELDGYDEALVPYDAPFADADSAFYLRDDTLRELLDSLRRKLGPHGQVVVFLDTCYSGTGTRGEAPERGAPPLGRPRQGLPALQHDWGSGFMERARGGKAGAEDLAPLVVFSAARAGETAVEASPPGFRFVGGLTWAVSEALARPPLPRSYRALIERVRVTMAGLVPNVPQAEGDLAAALFLGEVTEQVPYFTVTVAEGAKPRVRIRPGTLAGLHPGDRLEVHRAGTTETAPATLLSPGQVVKASPHEAEVELSSPVAGDLLTSARAFVTHHSVGDQRLRLTIGEDDRNAVNKGLAARLSQDGSVEIVTSRAEVALESCAEARPAVLCRALWDRTIGTLLQEETAAHWEELVPGLARRLRLLARNRSLRRLDLYDSRVHTNLSVHPVELRDCRDPVRPTRQSCRVVRLPQDRIRSSGGEIELPVDSFFELQIEGSQQTAFLSVLDLMADGSIAVLWPPAGGRERNSRGQGTRHILDEVFQVTKPYGTDIFLLVASAEPIDFSPLQQPAPLTGRGGDLVRLGPLAPLFEDAAHRGKELPAIAVSTTRQAIRIVPPAPDVERRVVPEEVVVHEP